MAQRLTPQEFQKMFGISVDDYLRGNPKALLQPEPAPQVAPSNGQRRYLQDDAGIRKAIAPLVLGSQSEQTQEPTPNPTPADQARSNMIELMPKFAQDVQANAISGVASIPAAVPGSVDLIRHGVPALVNGTMSADEAKSWTERVGDAFMDSAITKDGVALLERAQEEEATRFISANPSATPDQIKQHLTAYADSEEFYQKSISVLSGGLRMANQIQDFANRRMIGGNGKRPDQMTAGDEAIQAIAQSFVGLGPTAVSKITGVASRALGERIASNVATRIAARTLEAVTPLTLPLSKSNIAINAGVGVAANEAIRHLQGEDTLVDYAEVYNPDEFPNPETFAAGTGITAAAILATPKAGRIIAEQVAQETAERVSEAAAKRDPLRGGNSLSTFENKMDPNLSRVTGTADQFAPVTKLAEKFKTPGDKEIVQHVDAVMSAGSHQRSVQARNNLFNYGMLDDMPNTIAFADVEKQIAKFDQSTKEGLVNYLIGMSRRQDNTIYMRTLNEELSTAETVLNAARISGDPRRMKLAATKLDELRTKKQALIDDTEIPFEVEKNGRRSYFPARPSMDDVSKTEYDMWIARGEANPAIKAVADAMKKINNDVIDYQVRHDVLTIEQAEEFKRDRPLYFQMRERDRPDNKGIVRKALLYKDQVAKAFQGPSDRGFFVNQASRDITGEGVPVNNPKDPIVAFKEAMNDAVQAVTVNRVRKSIVDEFRRLPNAEGKALRQFSFKSGNRDVTSVSTEQLRQPTFLNQIKHPERLTEVLRNGKHEFWEFADPGVTNALKMAPLSYVPMMNGIRKFYQQNTTGLLAPWFSAVQFAWEPQIARATMQRGRSLGLIDTYARRLVSGTALDRPVNILMDHLPDPTAYLSAAHAIDKQFALRAARELGNKVAHDLANNSGVFAAIANSSPQGKKLVEWVGTTMANAWDRSTLAVMSKHMNTSLSHLNDASKIFDDYNWEPSRLRRGAGALIAPYKALLESVHMSTKYAFFAENLGRLELKYGGRENIPTAQMEKLAHETRILTGDMARQSGSKWVQNLTSVVPYSNAIIQGTRHILSAAVPDVAAKGVNALGGNMLTDKNQKFWTQFLGGILMPKIAALYALSQWEGAEDYWYNKVPSWQQMSGIPIPSPEVLEHYFNTGQFPEFKPEHINIVPLAPEFTMFTEPVIAGLRGMGLMDKRPGIAGLSSGLGDVLAQATSFTTPPLVAAAVAATGNRIDLNGMFNSGGVFTPINDIPQGGANADMMTINSDIPAVLFDVVSALAGSSVNIGIQTLNVMDITADKGGDMWDIAAQGWDTAKFEVTRRLPKVDIPLLFNARDRQYSFTPESQYVFKSNNDLETVFNQLSVERDKKGTDELARTQGLDTPEKIRDPMLLGLSNFVYDRLKKKGAYKEASEGYTMLKKHLTRIEGSRYRMSDNRYNELRNQTVQQQQTLTQWQAAELQKLEGEITKSAAGQQFMQRFGEPFSFAALSKYVRKDVSQ